MATDPVRPDDAGIRVALGLQYCGSGYCGWQSQPGGCGVQDRLEGAIARFLGVAVRTTCAGRTDAGVHAVGQVVHLDSTLRREEFSWVRGVNAYLPPDIAVQWARELPNTFDARRSAVQRRYRYLLRNHPVRPALEHGRVGWTHRPLDIGRMCGAAARCLVGERDFSAFRSSECQAASPVKTLHDVRIAQQGGYVVFDFRANAFLHHMVRNLVGSLIAVGSGAKGEDWLAAVVAGRDRKLAAPTFMPDGLYFVGPDYPPEFALPAATAALVGVGA